MVLLAAQNAFAANFTIAPVGILPTTVTSGQSVSANFTLTNMTHTARDGYYIAGLPSTVTQNTTAPNCTNPINLAANASCNLQLDITGAVSSNFAICKGNSCTTATTPLNVSVSTGPSYPKFAYVADNGVPGVIQCRVEASTGDFINCGGTGSGFNNPSAITLNSAGTIAYVGNYGDGTTANPASFCTVDSVTGALTNCASTPITSAPFIGTSGITLNPSGTYAYVSSVQNSILYKCQITGDGSLNNCTSTGSGYGGPGGIAFNAVGTMVYVTDYSAIHSPEMTKCPVDLTTGEIGVCTRTGSGFDYPYAIALNTDKTMAYVTNYNGGSVSLCNIAPVTAELVNCNPAVNISIPFGLAVNKTNTYAYVGSSYLDDTVYKCMIGNAGALSGCISTGSGFVNPYGIVLAY